MSDTRSQLEEIDALIAATPDDPSLHQLREDLLQLIALEEQEPAAINEQQQHAVSTSAEQQSSAEDYLAQGTFMEDNVASSREAPDIGSFQPVVYSSNNNHTQSTLKNGDASNNEQPGSSNLLVDDTTNSTAGTATSAAAQQQQQPPPPDKKKKKKKKNKDDAVLDATFELPSHLVQLDSDTPAQKLKKQRTAKALKSKFRGKQKEAEHAKRQSDWKSFTTKRKKASGSIFSTEEGVDAKVGVISGGGGRKMTGFIDPNKRHKFT